MEFLEGIDTLYYYIFFGIIFLIGRTIVEKKDDLKLSLKYYLYSYGVMMLLFYISLPHVFPGSITDLKSKMLLYYLQKNNDALAQTTEIVRMMAFMTFIFISMIIGKIINHLKIEKSVK